MTTTTLAARWRSWAPYLLSVLRIIAAFVFMQFGSAKLVAIPAAIMPGGGTAPLTSLPGIAGSLELVSGAFLLLGLFTRPVAFLVSGEMAFAYFMGHAPSSFFPILNSGDSAILYCFVFLYLAFAGAGPWSVDALIERKSSSR